MHLERNGQYWRAVWKDDLGRKRTKGLGNIAYVSERAAQQKLKALVAAQATGNLGAGSNITLRELVDTYLSVHNGISAATRVTYEQTGHMLYAHFGEDAKANKLLPGHADEWQAWLRTQVSRRGKGAEGIISPATVAKHIRNAKSVFRWAERRGHVTRNPFADLSGRAPKVSRRAAPIDDGVIRDLLEACPDADWRCLIALCAYAGTRRGEAMRLEWEDIHWDRGRLVIRVPEGETESNKRRFREVRMEPELERVLLEHRDRERPVSVLTNNLHRQMKAIVRRSGHQPWRRPFHALRDWRDRTWKMVHPEFVVDAWLGHSMEVSRQFYLQVPETFYQTDGAGEDPRHPRQRHDRPGPPKTGGLCSKDTTLLPLCQQYGSGTGVCLGETGFRFPHWG